MKKTVITGGAIFLSLGLGHFALTMFSIFGRHPWPWLRPIEKVLVEPMNYIEKAEVFGKASVWHLLANSFIWSALLSIVIVAATNRRRTTKSNQAL